MAPDSTTSPRPRKFAVDNSVDFWENARRFPHHAPPDRRRTPNANVNDTSTTPSEFLSQTFFVPSLSATDKQGVLAELADVVVARGIVPAADRDAILAALVEREEKMSTGMQYGIAIPHAKTEFVDRLVTMIAVSRAGVPFETLDGEPASIFIATLSPPEDANSHIRFLAVVTRQLANRRVREKVLEAATKEDLVAAFEKPEGASL